MLNPRVPSFDSDPDLVNDAVYNDNLSISLGDFFAILDEEPPPSQTFSPIAQKSLVQWTPEADPIGSEKVFQLKEEDLEGFGKELGSSQCTVGASDCLKETFSGLYQAEESFNHLTSSSYSLPITDGTQHTFSRSFHTSPSASFSVPVGAAEGASSPPLQYEDFGNDFFLDGDEGRDSEQMDGEISLQQGVRESESNASNMSALCLLQNGGTESLRNMLTEKFGLSDAINAGPIPSSVVEERNLCASMTRHPCIGNDANLADTFHSEVDFGEATDILCNADGSCLTLNRESATNNIEIGLGQFLSEQIPQPFVSYKKEPMIHLKDDKWKNQLLLSQNLCISSEMQLHTQEGLIDTSLSERRLSDFDASSSGTLSYDRNHYEDIFFRSESSTDSSPLPSSRNSSSENVHRSLAHTTRHFLADSDVYLYSEKQVTSSENARRDEMLSSCHKQHNVPKGSNIAQRNPARSCSSVDDDDDVDLCILDDISDPAQPQLLPVHRVSQQSVYGDPYIPQLGGMRFKEDERLTFRLALQDLSQPKSEASPPEGVLAVPLLRHQRIALSWMMQKETASLHCSGGILADDQGLGKTVSTIALILMERSSSFRSSGMDKQNNYEALNLEDDDIADVSEPGATKHPRISSPVDTSCPVKRENPVMMVKSRPAAGTLVVCPTSVLRQWAEELQNKVTGKANLSFLVYHGSNRTKDPYELAKYDVVLTTYAIVSMEVPKQPLVDKDDEEKGKHDAFGQPMGSLSGKKRKNSSSKNLKDGNIMENALLESATRPLGRVAWFRVILDEAQSIKNHRTQVARACWGLRAKRRWCLSGTPIQNAVDDLYSYFRFLRYDPYAVYKSFCSMIKVPISRNPTNGYKKLQAVLKTIMLRRTKGALIDGKPIITLPAKTVTLKKVDFSMEERAFYSILEAESREQFKVYAAAGTVKQNYVNILLMLLRLRQACDHPLLVKGYDSNSVWRCSLEMASKLPREKREHLICCLEAGSAICTICNDAPEDAVVSICGHVFCNQCICEHLTGDDSICPAASCKFRLSISSLFSRGTLTSSLSGLSGDDCSHFSGKEMEHAEKLSANRSSYDSSKVKAALEILQSLPLLDNSQTSNCRKSYDGITVSSQNAASTVSLGCSSETSNGKHSDSNRCSEGLVTEKAIVFSQWTRMLDLLEVPLKDSYIQYRRLDGTMSVAAREKAVKDFNTLPEVTVMIMSLKAASLGLNMVAACHVLLLDLWWNPTTEDQAIDRAHRIGQTRPVTVSRLTVKDTVEDRILALQDKKREMVASAFGEDESGSRQTRLTVEDLKYLFMV
ncbi:helicase-like transcription factor CHR28 isoform X1 [Typha angustifolia]|uniref:helicase-like transcription factor CHR28 isoform X1 n=1 Tax=Typha angustifolia TaxID=59011 RepID=UPI003C308357